MELSADESLALYRELAGDLYDERATRLGLLAGLVWLGWDKATVIATHRKPELRDRERAALRWWLARAAEALEDLPG